MSPDIAEVLDGTARWAMVHADNRTVLPTLPAKSVAHVITDPPYEAEAHTLRRRVKRQDGDGENSKWGGADRRHAQLSPLVWADLRGRTGIGRRAVRQARESLVCRLLSSGGRHEMAAGPR